MINVLLGVNIDHVATIRNARNINYPDPVLAALIAEQSGADSITVHLREDRRHINERDIHILSKTINTRMNLEIAITEEMLNLACRIKPYSCCLVPEKRQELTTESGLDVINEQYKISSAINVLKKFGIISSLFIDADKDQIEAAASSNAQYIEIHTGNYALMSNILENNEELNLIRKSVIFATKCGLKVNAGHGLNYHNVQPIAAIHEIHELNIGHSIISRALIIGLSNAVKEMKNILKEARYK
ncbi:MAG: pyridoxine 5'-phosphate synthase [Pantoea sp. Brub]|nr:pyridoxine 5'-phosphate synthase [Pantoea sp. Brub]